MSSTLLFFFHLLMVGLCFDFFCNLHCDGYLYRDYMECDGYFFIFFREYNGYNYIVLYEYIIL